MKLSLFFISFLLLPYLTQLIYVPNCGSFPLQNALKPPIHVAAIIESDAGILGTTNHAFLFHQIHCAINEQHSKVQIDGWKVDNEYKTCTNINSDNPTENIVHAAAFSSPPEHSRTLCEILEVAKKCANQYNNINGVGTEKLHIVAGLLLHDEIGNCKIEEMFPSVNFHLTIFWVHGHRKPPSVHSEIIDYAILESITDITPKDGWIMPEVSLEQLKEAQEAGNGNPIFDSLYLRLKRMSDNAKGRTTTRKSRRSQRMKEIQSTTPIASMSSLPSATTSPMMATEILSPEKSNLASFLFDCQTAAAASKSDESGKIQKRFADDNEMFSPCLLLFLLRLLPGNPSTNLNNYGKMIEGIPETHLSSADYYNISSTSSVVGSSDTTVTSTISTTTEETTVASNISSSTKSFNATEILNTTKNAAEEEELCFLEKIGEAFGNKDHGILYLLLIILFVLLILCGISILIYCLWPKTDHYEVNSKTKPSDGNGNTVGGKAAAPKDGTAKTSTSTESAKKKKRISSNKDAASSNKKLNSNVNKKTFDVSSKKSPVKSILRKSPHQKQQENPSKKEAVNQQKPITSHSISSLSDRSQTNIEIPPPPISPAGITPAPSALSLVENTNMKFNDNKNFEAPPELQPPGINNNNNPLSLY